jgi:ATP-dependent Lon protease
MPRHRYNLRSRPKDVKWVEDDTLIENDDDSEDEDYVPSEEEATTASEVEDDEDAEAEDEDEDEDEEDEEPPKQSIQIPMPARGQTVQITIHGADELVDLDDDEDEEDEEEDIPKGGFLGYLMNKYVPSNKRTLGSKKGKDPESPALSLNDEEQEYFEDLPKSKQKKLNKQMKQLSTLVSSDVPHKFRVLELPVSESIKAAVIKKINVLNEMDSDAGESHKLRTWVDGFLRIPFGTIVPLPVKLEDGSKPCSAFLSDTRKTLDKAVYGMQGAKTQVMQILAQWISNPTSVGNVIALQGPMGVGKTSFARNGISAVLKRPFEFFSLGGAADAANFVGHSYTYEGAQWGRIADSIMNARCMNPVMYFDELDKVSETAHGQEIVSMLIHLTDRSQNSQFHDRYFAGVEFDLSQCLFVFSFNDESKVHPILKDRMQVIHCSGYTADEKKIILTQYVWPQILDRIKMADDLKISDEAIKFLISEFSKDEEGVRTLMRAVEALVTRINLLRIADEETAKSYKFYTKITLPLTIDVETAKHILQELETPKTESWKMLYS